VRGPGADPKDTTAGEKNSPPSIAGCRLTNPSDRSPADPPPAAYLRRCKQPHQRQILDEVTHQHRLRGQQEVIDQEVWNPKAEAGEQKR